MSKKEKRTRLIGIGDWVVDENDMIKEAELKILLEQAEFWDDDYKTLVELLKCGCTQQEIANELHTSQATVARMIKRLRKYLTENL